MSMTLELVVRCPAAAAENIASQHGHVGRHVQACYPRGSDNLCNFLDGFDGQPTGSVPLPRLSGSCSRLHLFSASSWPQSHAFKRLLRHISCVLLVILRELVHQQMYV